MIFPHYQNWRTSKLPFSLALANTVNTGVSFDTSSRAIDNSQLWAARGFQGGSGGAAGLGGLGEFGARQNQWIRGGFPQKGLGGCGCSCGGGSVDITALLIGAAAFWVLYGTRGQLL